VEKLDVKRVQQLVTTGGGKGRGRRTIGRVFAICQRGESGGQKGGRLNAGLVIREKRFHVGGKGRKDGQGTPWTQEKHLQIFCWGSLRAVCVMFYLGNEEGPTEEEKEGTAERP